jgi:hypothetical protein
MDTLRKLGFLDEKEPKKPATPGSTQLWSFVFLSALTLYIPATVSIWTQPFPITLILFASATWSSLYHYHREQEYGQLDVIWANITSLFTALMLILVSMQFGFFSKQVMWPLFVALVALFIYDTKAFIHEGETPQDVPNYNIWHGIWHLLSSLTALLLVYHKTNYKYALKPFSFLFRERMRIPWGKLNPKAFVKDF